MKPEKTKIVIVEDDSFLSEMYAVKFKEANFEVHPITDSSQAVEDILKIKPDIILLDIVLPHIDGYEILRRIKKNAEVKNTPVIFLSNLGQEEEIREGLKLGAAAYIVKAHFTPTEIVAKVKEVLNKN